MKLPRSEKEINIVKEKILGEALGIIVDDGFESLTMRRLASKIGMTAPNIYNYFANKDVIYITLVIRGFEKLLATLNEARDSHDDPVERGIAMMRSYLAFGMNNSRYYNIMFTLSTPKHNDYVGTPFEELSKIEHGLSMDIATLATQTMSDIFQNRPEITDEKVLELIVQIWCLLHGMASLHNSNVIKYLSQDSQIETIYDHIINNLFDTVVNT
ncbi:MAG: TetR/AcrR family transcriptional regulator [Deltaproteobacteria bacterium]|nr:TetR/AcrR family transcriptional regulator [Deltaproteobacteria bacterium]